jgi:hypothetical protein
MNRSFSLGCTVAFILGTVGACSSGDPGGTPALTPMAGTGSTSQPATAGTTSGGGGAAASPSAGTASGGAGTTTVAGTAAGGSAGQAPAAGSGGMSGGASGGTGGTGSGGASSSGLYEGPFTCTMYIGAYLSMEWWNAGFQGQTGIDDAKWQLKWHHHGHVTEWAKPDSPFWADTGNALDDSQGSPIESKCTQSSNAPDRIVFVALSWALTTEEGWTTALNADIANIKAKYPSVKRVDVMTMIRCPTNMQCNPNAVIGGPDSDTNAGVQDCQVPAFADSAIAKLIAANPGYVALGPQFDMTMCNPAHNGAHMTGADNTIAAQKMAAFYAAKP